jgi:hypothetical protein
MRLIRILFGVETVNDISSDIKSLTRKVDSIRDRLHVHRRNISNGHGVYTKMGIRNVEDEINRATHISEVLHNLS